VVFLSTDNNFITVNLKGTQLSNNTEAYNNNSQRKFVRTDNGNLHNVYISMGSLWYERSTDGGTTWEIANNGKPVNTNNPKQASIDYLRPGTGDEIMVIAYQQQTSTGSQVVIDVYKNGLPRAGVFRYEVISFSHSASEYVNMNAEPVIALADQWDFLIVYKIPGFLPLIGDSPTTSGLYYSFGWLNGLIGWELTWWSPNNKWVIVPTTGQNSIHPSLDDDIYSSYNYFHLAYEENNQVKYYYRYGQPRTGSLVQTGNPYCISDGNGFTQNYQPSIIGMGTTARVCWVGFRLSYVEQEQDDEVNAVPQYKVLFKCPTNPGSFWQFGSNVSSPNINNQNDNTYYAIGWSENQSQLKFADNSLSTVRTLSDVTGQNIRISNGTNKNSMYAMAYEHNVGAPFYFERSNNLGSFYVPAKITNTYFSSGREGIVSVDSAAFYFALGDVLVDGAAINFKEMSDSIVINNLNSLNDYLITEPFDLSDNSSFIYSVQFGLNDSLSAVQAIVDNKFINFKLFLIDNNTNEVISEYDNITFNSTNLFQYNNIAYVVNTQGIGNRTVTMKLLVDVNFDAGYSLSQIYSNSEEGVLGKSKIKQINFNDGEIITTYELSQNYPNPFNPNTTIKYQIPMDGIVTLKIFDILGAEVATLVNEEKVAGKYEVNFSASSFASGVTFIA
jgi:hypothetical protein